MTSRPYKLVGRALGAVEGGWRFHRAHGATFRRARALCLTADLLDVRRPRDWQGRARRLYRRAARDLDVLAAQDASTAISNPNGTAELEPELARHAHRSLALAARPYRRTAVALGALVAASVALAALIVLLGCLVFPGMRARLFPHDLAERRPWLASSAVPPFPRHGLGPSTATGDFFFQTYPGDHPWIAVDLGAPKIIRSLRVENRRDCCQDRALPLDVEVMDEQKKKWRLVAQRRAGFNVWTHDIAPVSARHVRFRLAGVGALHLRRISLYEW